MISNWKHFRHPYEPLGNFTRSEPFPSDEVKATAIDSPSGKKMPRSKKKVRPRDGYRALMGRG